MYQIAQLTGSLKGRLLLLFAAAICFFAAYFIAGNGSDDFSKEVSKFEKVLHEKEEYAKGELKELAEKSDNWSYHDIFSEKPGYYESLFEREGLVFLIFENDSLRFWTDNTVAVDLQLPKNAFTNKIARLPNGWFGIERFAVGNKKLFALILLKREYAYQNKYLTNEFQRDFHLNNEAEVVIDPEKYGAKITPGADRKSNDVFERKGDYLCTIKFPVANSMGSFAFYFSVFLNLIGFFFSVWLLQSEVDSLRNNIGRGWSVLLLAVTVFVLRYLTLQIHFPEIFYGTKLFSPELYGDAAFPWLGSLGDLLINAALVFYLTFYVYRNTTPSPVFPAKG